MFCPKCGKINPDNGEICSGCGASLLSEKAAVTEKKGHGVLKAVIIGVIIVIAALVAVFLLNGCGRVPLPDENMTF